MYCVTDQESALRSIAMECRTPAIAEVDLLALLTLLADIEAPGDVIEMGCFQGGTSLALARVITLFCPTRTLHLVDSFRGLPEPTGEDGEFAEKASMTADLADLVDKFDPDRKSVV